MKYIKCPKCELNYIDADKQEMCDVCLSEVATKIKPTKHGTSTVQTIVKEPIRYNGRAVFFVFQNKEFEDEFANGIIKAPYYDKGKHEPHHWARLKNVKKGDIILHCVVSCVVAISEAQGACYDFNYPDGKLGRKVDCEYHLLDEPLSTQKYNKEIFRCCPNYKYQPFNKNGNGNEGYLFDICKEAATLFISDIVAHNPSLAKCAFIKDILPFMK